MVLLILLLLGILIFNIWNLLTLNKIKKSRPITQYLSDPKYYELKAKQDFLVAIFTVFCALAAFIGYNSINTIENNVKSEINDNLTENKNDIKKIEDVLRLTDSTVNTFPEKFKNYETFLNYLEKKQTQILQTNSLSEIQIHRLNQKIKEINEKNKLQQDIYIVENIEYNISKEEESYKEKVRFSDLITNSGDRLPIFKKAPFIIPITNDGIDFFVFNITSQEFSLKFNQLSTPYLKDTNTKLKVSFLIRTNP